MPVTTDDGQVYADEVDHLLGKPVKEDSEEAKSMTHEPTKAPDKVSKVINTINQGVADTVTAGPRLMQDFAEGKTSSDDADAIKRSFDVVSSLAGGGAAGAEKDAVGIFGGRMSQGAVRTAEGLEKLPGVSPDQIKKWTGLERGADMFWRKEIDDSAAKYDPSQLARVSDKEHMGFLDNVLQHDKLFAAYPEAKDIMVVHKKGMSDLGVAGRFSPAMNTIEINADRTLDQQKSTILHEVQHWVQNKEGFAIDSPENFSSKFRDQMMGHYLRTYQDGLKSVVELAEAGHMNAAREHAQNLILGARNEFYRSLGSEVEARNTQARRNMSPTERLRLGEDTEDVPRDKQIVGTMNK